MSGLPVCRVAGRERTLLQYQDNIGNEKISDGKVVIHNLGQVGEEGRKLRSRPHCGRHTIKSWVKTSVGMELIFHDYGRITRCGGGGGKSPEEI